MAPTVREADCKATPAVIWKTCFEHMKWEKWDPDVEAIEDATELKDDASLTFIMKEGPIKKIPCTLSQVKENESLCFTGAAAGGLMNFSGLIEISTTSKDDTATSTSHIKYTFDLAGPLGRVVMWLNPKPAVEGTEGGLANIVKLSEEA